MAQGVRDPGPVSRHISPKQRDKGGSPGGKDQCLTWINVCLSALGRFLAWRSASSHSFLTWSERNREREGNEVRCTVVLLHLFTHSKKYSNSISISVDGGKQGLSLHTRKRPLKSDLALCCILLFLLLFKQNYSHLSS